MPHRCLLLSAVKTAPKGSQQPFPFTSEKKQTFQYRNQVGFKPARAIVLFKDKGQSRAFFSSYIDWIPISAFEYRKLATKCHFMGLHLPRTYEWALGEGKGGLTCSEPKSRKIISNWTLTIILTATSYGRPSMLYYPGCAFALLCPDSSTKRYSYFSLNTLGNWGWADNLFKVTKLMRNRVGAIASSVGIQSW